MERAREALGAGRYADYLMVARQFAARAPNHPGVIYAVARGLALVGRPDSALGWLDRADVDSLEAFLRPDSDRFSDANGIALAPGDRTLYVAFLEGIARVDVRTGQITRVRAPESTSTAEIDGLYWYRGALLGVQHAPGLEQVARYQLTRDGGSIRRVEVLERGEGILHLPTTGAVVGTRFFYIANSQFDRLGDDNRLSPATESPAPLTVVRVIDLEQY